MIIDKDKYLKMIEAILFVGSDLVDEKDIRLKIPAKAKKIRAKLVIFPGRLIFFYFLPFHTPV